MQDTSLVNPSSNTSQKYISNTICGFPISTAALEDNMTMIDAMAESGQGGWIVTLNTEMLAKCAREEDYASLLRRADLFTADGMPLIWASRRNRQSPITDRTTGVDIVESFLRRDNIPNYAIIGGVDPEEALKNYPNAMESCAYLYTGSVSVNDEHQMDEFAKKLRENKIHYVFLALGVPKQDKVALEIRARYPEAILLGIGGTFEILAPGGGRAPQWMQKSGLEWFYRFVKEPRRLWKRYLLNYPVGISALIRDATKR